MEKRAGRFVVALPNWYGSVAKVAVNGKPAGFIDAPPWECDVTKWIKRGQNEVEVTVIGTLKNTLGPHHGKPALGAAWPGGFHVGPSPGPPPGAELFHRGLRPLRAVRAETSVAVASSDGCNSGAGVSPSELTTAGETPDAGRRDARPTTWRRFTVRGKVTGNHLAPVERSVTQSLVPRRLAIGGNLAGTRLEAGPCLGVGLRRQLDGSVRKRSLKRRKRRW